MLLGYFFLNINISFCHLNNKMSVYDQAIITDRNHNRRISNKVRTAASATGGCFKYIYGLSHSFFACCSLNTLAVCNVDKVSGQ